MNVQVSFIGAACSGESCKIGKGWFWDSLNDRMQWLMKEGEWSINGTKLEITVKLTDPEDPPVLKVSFLAIL